MNLQLEFDLYKRIVAYLSRAASMQDFRRWFDAATWDQQPWKSPMIGAVELALSEFLNGDRSETEVRDALSVAIANVTIVLPVPIITGGVVTESDSAIRVTPAWGATATILGSPSVLRPAVECV